MDLLHPPKEPFSLLEAWYSAAKPLGEQIADAMTLATVDSVGQPSARIVLLRGLSQLGLSFYTNYDSRKGRELEATKRAAAVLYWQALGKQVRVEGVVERMSLEDSERYFHGRPRGSQVAAWASPQSQVIAPLALKQQVEAIAARFVGQKTLPCPPNWGGYILRPTVVEFWQEAEFRLHQRLQYKLSEGAWAQSWLAP